MKKLFVLGLMALVTNVMAGDKGNGGYSVVCRDANKKITSAELLDIFEGRFLNYYGYSNNPSLTEADYVNYALDRMAKHNKRTSEAIQKSIIKIEAVTVFIDQDLVLEPTEDAFPVIGRRDCGFEQLATYINGDQLIVSSEIYSHLSPLNKAALKLHEAIYLNARKVGEVNSINSRALTSWALALSAESNDRIKKFIDKLDVAATPVDVNRVCGFSGTLDQRIRNCDRSIITKGGHEWKLVQAPYFAGLHEIYLAPTLKLVRLGNMSVDPRGHGKKSARKRAESYLKAQRESRLCDFQLRQGDIPSELSVDFQLATSKELNELYTKYDANEVLSYVDSSNTILGDMSFNGDCNYQNLFTAYYTYNIFSNENRKVSFSCDLQVFNPRLNKEVTRKVDLTELGAPVLCIGE